MLKRLIALTILLTACQSQLKGNSTVEQYLKAVQAGNLQAQQDVSCVREDAVSSPIKSAPAWSIVGEEQRETQTVPNFSYKLVTAKIGDTSQQFKVWKTEDAYKSTQTALEQTKQKGLMLETLTPPRSQWSSQEFCLGVVK